MGVFSGGASPKNLPHLAELSFSEIIALTFNIYRQNFLIFVLLVTLIQVPLTVANFALSQSLPQEQTNTLNEILSGNFDFQQQQTTNSEPLNIENLGASLMAGLVGIAAMFLNFIVIMPLITIIASEKRLGRDIPLDKAFGLLFGRILLLIAGAIILGIIFFVTAVGIGIFSIICILPALLLIVLLYYYLATYFFFVPVFVLEDVDLMLGLSRTVALGKVRFWPNYGFWFAIQIITFIISLLVSTVGILASGGDLSAINPIFTAANMISAILIGPILPIGMTVLYYDNRIRLEGLGVALQSVAVPDPRPGDIVSPQPNEPLFTGQDAINMLILLCVGLIVIIALLVLIFGLMLIIAA